MIRRFTAPVLLAALAAGLSGCNALYAGLLMGMKNTPPNTPARLREDAQRYQVPPDRVFVLDTSYLRFVRRLARQPRSYESAKNHAQLLQLLYFDQAGQLVSFHINCYADPKLPSPNLRWNPDGQLNTFPPRTQVRPDSLLSFSQLLTFLRTPEGQPVEAARFAGQRPVVVFWSHTMGRQTRILLSELRQNLTRVPPNEAVPVLYVNNDAYLGLLD